MNYPSFLFLLCVLDEVPTWVDLLVCGLSLRLPRRESKIASSEKMRIGGTAEMAWMQICDPSDKEKGHYSIEVSDGVTTHTRTFDLSGQGSPHEYKPET